MTFSHCTPGGRTSHQESSSQASPEFPGSARSLPLTDLRGCGNMRRPQLPDRKAILTGKYFFTVNTFLQFWKTTE